jgi:hypothetical protein
MDDITQQMKSVALSGNANKNDANDFNAGLFKYLLFVSKNAGTKNIWSDADKDLKAWMRKQNKEFLQLMTCDIFYYRYKNCICLGQYPTRRCQPFVCPMTGGEVPTTPLPNSRRRASLSSPLLSSKLDECIVLMLRKRVDPSSIITRIRDNPSR